MAAKKDFEFIKDDARMRIDSDITSFCDEIRSGTKEPEQFMTIFDLEKIWGEHKNHTSQIYSDVLSDMLAQVNQGELIKRKK